MLVQPLPTYITYLSSSSHLDDSFTVYQYDDRIANLFERSMGTFVGQDVLDDLSQVQNGQKLYLRKSSDEKYRVVAEDNGLKRQLRIHCLSCCVLEPSIRTVQILKVVFDKVNLSLQEIKDRSQYDRLRDIATQELRGKIARALSGVARLRNTYHRCAEEKATFLCFDKTESKNSRRALEKVTKVEALFASLESLQEKLREENITPPRPVDILPAEEELGGASTDVQEKKGLARRIKHGFMKKPGRLLKKFKGLF